MDLEKRVEMNRALHRVATILGDLEKIENPVLKDQMKLVFHFIDERDFDSARAMITEVWSQYSEMTGDERLSQNGQDHIYVAARATATIRRIELIGK
jgi:hypothetical protein